MDLDYDYDEVRWACLNGQCGPFASLLSARTGWPVGTVQSGPDAEDGVHAVVYHPLGGVVDAAGWHLDAARYAEVYAHAVGLTGVYEIVPLDDPEYGYGPGYDGADFPPIILIDFVFKLLDNIGYVHDPDASASAPTSPVVREMLARYFHRHDFLDSFDLA